MKRINKAEFESLDFVSKHYRGISNPVRDEVRKLQVGDGLIVGREEWAFKTPMSNAFTLDGKRMGYSVSVRRLADNSGTAIIRKS